jgi:diadenosine tetraphosphate (Ap4A) HIT family hydrolase
MAWLQSYGFSDCVLCDIVDHQPWEPATFVYEDDDVAVFHNLLQWIPVMLLVVPRRRLAGGPSPNGRHYEQHDLWRGMGRLGAVAMRMGRTHCRFDGEARFRLVCNVGSLALQTQSHAHIHVLGSKFEPSYPDLRTVERLVYEDTLLTAYQDQIKSARQSEPLVALMVVPKQTLNQDEFFARMDEFGETILTLAERFVGPSFRFLAEVGQHAPLPNDGAHLYILGGGWLGHYV